MAQYPVWLAGQDITASKLQDMVENVTVKSISTDRASNTTLTLDPDLQFAAAAGVTYWVRFYCWFAAVPAADVKTSWTIPAGVTGNRSVQGPGSAASQADMDNISMRHGVHGYATSISYGSRTSAANHFLVVEESVVQVSATAGTIGLNWAQVVSDVTASQLRAGSTLTYRRIG